MGTSTDQIVAGVIRYCRLDIARRRSQQFRAGKKSCELEQVWVDAVVASEKEKQDAMEVTEELLHLVRSMIRGFVKNEAEYELVVERFFIETPFRELAARYEMNTATARVLVHRVKKELMAIGATRQASFDG